VARPRQRVLHYLIALVWLVNGLLCKVLGLVPRHAAIVARILGPSHADLLTLLIGLAARGLCPLFQRAVRVCGRHLLNRQMM
jgi:hypothetical protein